MDYNQKSRGQKHHKNKARYKSKHVKNKNTETTSAHKPIVNHVEPSSSEDESESDCPDWNDFSLLAQAPISIGGHFQFKSDKNTDSECTFKNLQQNDLFSLDLNILQYSLNCIPFFERCGLDKSLFLENEFEKMNKRANSNKVQYESYLRLTLAVKDDSANAITGGQKNGFSQQNLEQSVSGIQGHIIADTLDDVKLEKPLVAPLKMEKVKAELEDWLDDILGD